MTTVRADRARNDELILRTAAQLLARDPGASMQAVADAAGVARLTVYRRYPDRQALLDALRAAVDAELNAALDDLPGWDAGREAIAALVTALARVAARYPVALLRYELGTGAAPAVDVRVIALLRGGQRAKVLRADVPATTLNTALFGVISAVLAADHTDADVAAATVLTLLLPGMTPPTRGVR